MIAAGAAAAAVGRLAGASIPIVPMRHQYLVTEPLDPAVSAEATTVRDPDSITYFRPEAGGLLVGGYSRDPVTWDVDQPLSEPRTLFEPDMERFAESWEGARRRVPALRDAEIAKVVNGPEAFTPDGEFILGETPAVAGLWVAAGFCVHGLAGAGGVGRVIAEWIVGGMPWVDVSAMDIAASATTSASEATLAFARSRPTRATTTSSIQARNARPAGPCACRPPTSASAS